VKVVRLLLGEGADMDKATNEGSTRPHWVGQLLPLPRRFQQGAGLLKLGGKKTAKSIHNKAKEFRKPLSNRVR